jgi:hypothetical protein
VRRYRIARNASISLGFLACDTLFPPFFKRVQVFAAAAFEERSAALGDFDALAESGCRTRRRSLIVWPGRDQKSASELRTGGPADSVHGLPGDEHRHDGSLPRSTGELEHETEQLGIGVVTGVF